MELITVQTCSDQTDADLVCSRLDAADFHPSVAHHGLTPLNLFPCPAATGGILVQVPEDEAEEARTFLADSISVPQKDSSNPSGDAPSA